MIIRPLTKSEYAKAVDLKLESYDEEVQGTAPNTMVKEDVLGFILDWVHTAKEHNDIRLVHGAFEGETFLGFAGASLAETYDSVNGVELNYLFVKNAHRGKGIALKLMHSLLPEFISRGCKELIVYNYHISPSNQFYQKLGGKVIKNAKEDHLLIDVFSFDVKVLDERITKMIKDRY